MTKQTTLENWVKINKVVKQNFCRYCKHFGLNILGRFVCSKFNKNTSIHSCSCDDFVQNKNWELIDKYFLD